MSAAKMSAEEAKILKKIIFLRMRDFCDMQYRTGNVFLLIFGQEMRATETLFEKLFGHAEAERCRKEWRMIVRNGADAFHDDLTEHGYVSDLFDEL